MTLLIQQKEPIPCGIGSFCMKGNDQVQVSEPWTNARLLLAQANADNADPTAARNRDNLKASSIVCRSQ